MILHSILAFWEKHRNGFYVGFVSEVHSLFHKEWCDSRGTFEEVHAKLQMRQVGSIKCERAIAYAFSNQVPNYFSM